MVHLDAGDDEQVDPDDSPGRHARIWNQAEDSYDWRESGGVSAASVGRLVVLLRPHQLPDDEQYGRPDKAAHQHRDRHIDYGGHPSRRALRKPEPKQAEDGLQYPGYGARHQHEYKRFSEPALFWHPPVECGGRGDDLYRRLRDS